MEMPSSVLRLKKKAWVPVVENNDGGITESKFAGTPYLLPDEEHPRCSNCDNPIQLFLQLNLDKIPQDLHGEFGEGLIQLFYCTNDDPLCDVECEPWLPFSNSVIARLIEIEGERLTSFNAKVKNPLPPKLVVCKLKFLMN